MNYDLFTGIRREATHGHPKTGFLCRAAVDGQLEKGRVVMKRILASVSPACVSHKNWGGYLT